MQLFKKLKRLFSSSSGYFYEPLPILLENKKRVDLYLQLKDYNATQRDIYDRAYKYFITNPAQFDGATMTEDLFDIDSLELAAMLHDWLYIKFNASGSFKYIWLADKLIRSEMRRMNKSSWNTGTRFVLLLIKTPFYVPYSWLFKSRRMTPEQKEEFNRIYSKLQYRTPKAWHKEFAGELTVTAVIIAVILAIGWRINLLQFLPFL